MTERQMLVNALRNVLVPALLERGFVAQPLAGDDARSAEIRAAFPFGRYRRPHAEGFEQIEVQLDKHSRPAFRLNAAFVPRSGIDHVAGHVACEDVWVHYMNRFAELYSSPVLRSWFALSRWRDTPADASAAYEGLARRAAKLLPELEQVIGDGVGRRDLLSHVRRVRA